MNVYCNDVDCAWCKRLEKRYIIRYRRDYVPLGSDSGYIGECTRKEIGIEPKIIHGEGNFKYNTMHCMTRSNKGLSGHKDFTKMVPEHLNSEQVNEYNRDKERKIY